MNIVWGKKIQIMEKKLNDKGKITIEEDKIKKNNLETDEMHNFLDKYSLTKLSPIKTKV